MGDFGGSDFCFAGSDCLIGFQLIINFPILQDEI